MNSDSHCPKAAIVIPARLASTRLPRKLLLNETGRSLIEHTYRAASASKLASQVIVAADEAEIVECVKAFGGQVQMTRADHQSGSSRVAEVALGLEEFEIIVNVQGDEPEISGTVIDHAIRLLADHPNAVVSTLASPIRDRKSLEQMSVVKVVFGADGHALYFSRSPIPCVRDWDQDWLVSEPATFYQHIGLYAYRSSFLPTFSELPASASELVESLEQLRILDAGYTIQVGVVEQHAVGIDTPEDYRAFVSRCKS